MDVLLLSIICVTLIIGIAVLGIVLSRHTETLAQIHTLVNSRLTEALNDITELKQALTTARRAKGRKQ